MLLNYVNYQQNSWQFEIKYVTCKLCYNKYWLYQYLLFCIRLIFSILSSVNYILYID